MICRGHTETEPLNGIGEMGPSVVSTVVRAELMKSLDEEQISRFCKEYDLQHVLYNG